MELVRTDELCIAGAHNELNALAADPVRQRYFGLEAEDFGQLVHEIIQGMSRLGLEKDMAQAVRDVSGYRNIRRDKLIWRQASMAAYCISAFVDWLQPRVRPRGQAHHPACRAHPYPLRATARSGRVSRPCRRTPCI